MRPLNDSLLRDLAAHDAPLCLSIFMEVAAGGGDHNQIRLSMKNAKSEAADAIRAAKVAQEAAAAVQERLDALDYGDIVGGHDRRIAVFIAPDLTEVVDARFEETGVHAGARFRLAPLVGDLELTPDHAILVASHDSASLFIASNGALTKQSVQGMPQSLTDISKFTDQQEKGNIHGREDSGVPGSYNGAPGAPTGRPGPQGVPHHSIGGHDWREDKVKDLRQYANLVTSSVQRHLSGTNVPLVIASDEGLYGMLRQSSEYPYLAEKGITLHPNEMDESTLRAEAASCLDAAVAKRREDAWSRIAMSLGRDDNGASDDPANIATASARGRVAHLFVRAGATLPGLFDEDSLAADVVRDGPDDLVDIAIVETLRNGGDVFPLGDFGDSNSLMTAVYRYPA